MILYLTSISANMVGEGSVWESKRCVYPKKCIYDRMAGGMHDVEWLASEHAADGSRCKDRGFSCQQFSSQAAPENFLRGRKIWNFFFKLHCLFLLQDYVF